MCVHVCMCGFFAAACGVVRPLDRSSALSLCRCLSHADASCSLTGAAKVLARKCSNSMERPISASQNVCTTVGAQEAIFNILTSTCDAGDEVVVLTPAYDAYFKAALLQDLTIKSIAMKYDSDRLDETGGQLDASHYYVDMDVRIQVITALKRALSLPPCGVLNNRPTHILMKWCYLFVLCSQELERSITEKTRVLFLNSPSSPFGKVMTRAELEKVGCSGICRSLSVNIYTYSPNVMHSNASFVLCW